MGDPEGTTKETPRVLESSGGVSVVKGEVLGVYET